ncbi:hypothetical protein M0802_011405 [Mischocyttarus mexicanus]|nr:hypothetical protein M0802_011405 [Mischocyttarus mexicanus]
MRLARYANPYGFSTAAIATGPPLADYLDPCIASKPLVGMLLTLDNRKILIDNNECLEEKLLEPVSEVTRISTAYLGQVGGDCGGGGGSGGGVEEEGYFSNLEFGEKKGLKREALLRVTDTSMRGGSASWSLWPLHRRGAITCIGVSVKCIDYGYTESGHQGNNALHSTMVIDIPWLN